MGKWVVKGALSARTVNEEAEPEEQRFVTEEVAEEESPVRIGASLGVWAASLIYLWGTGLGVREGGGSSRMDGLS